MPVVWKFHLRHEENFPGFPIPCVLGFTMFVLCYLDLFSHYIFCLKSTLFRKFTRDFPCLERAARNYRAKQMCKFQKGSHRETQEHERYFTHIACGIWEHSIQVGKISVPTKKKRNLHLTWHCNMKKCGFQLFNQGVQKSNDTICMILCFYMGLSEHAVPQKWHGSSSYDLFISLASLGYTIYHIITLLWDEPTYHVVDYIPNPILTRFLQPWMFVGFTHSSYFLARLVDG